MENLAEILFEEITGQAGNIGLITLNRPAVLNALNHNMFRELTKQLTTWGNASNIKAVVIRANGRAFCAGGDIRYAYERGKAGDQTLPGFFGDEYKMNRMIYNFPKPFIALMNGLTMGGGAGISINGSYRVATPNFSLAMPEVNIGFYPDVGMGYFLSRLPYKIGFYLGLTGERATYEDCLALELVDVVVESDALDNIVAKLADAKIENDAQVAEVLKYFSVPVGKSQLMAHDAEIQTCFAKQKVEDIFNTLENYPSAWCETVAAMINTKSPTSLKVTLRQLLSYARMSFDECIESDFRITSNFLTAPDFFEGVRAAIIDKDQHPRWNPATIRAVSDADIEKYFKA
jgi:enoyl-CoA hydratase